MPLINLPNRIDQANYFTETPFPIFEMENFLTDDFYQALVADVKNRTEFDRVFSSKGNKKKLSLRGKNFDKFEDSPFKQLVGYFLSEAFFEWFVETHLPYFETDADPVMANDKSKKDVDKLRETDERDGVKRAYYATEVHYSSIEQDGFIPPHTDSPKKRLSFVLYLPDELLPEEMQRNLGTVFYGPKDDASTWEMFESGLLNTRKTDQFLDTHAVAHVSMFQPNKCIGFIKSDISWHAVSPNQFEYDRRAIVININEI